MHPRQGDWISSGRVVVFPGLPSHLAQELNIDTVQYF